MIKGQRFRIQSSSANTKTMGPGYHAVKEFWCS